MGREVTALDVIASLVNDFVGARERHRKFGR